MKPLRSSFMPNGISVGLSNIGIAKPASTFNDPIADLPDAAAPMQQDFMTTGDFGHSPIDVQTEMAQSFLFFGYLLSFDASLFSTMQYVFRHGM